MKKTLIVAAALAACGLAQAQSSATLYGNVDLSLESMKVTGQSAQTRVTSGAGAPSKWGLRGEEDLGNGLKAMFNLEAGFSADTGGVSAGKAFSRLANVGLKSATLGELRLGRRGQACQCERAQPHLPAITTHHAPSSSCRVSGLGADFLACGTACPGSDTRVIEVRATA